MAFFMFFSCFFFQKKIRNKKITELEFLKLIVGCCQAKFRGCKSGVQVWLLKYFWFSRNGVFYDFFIIFKKKSLEIKKLRYKKLTELEFLNSIVGCCQAIFRSCKSGVQL